MERIKLIDIAEKLGVSTATVSNVLHGKTNKVSSVTVKRVQEELESSGYIPNMAGILLARNNSRIIGVVVNDHEKYEGKVLEDGFVSGSLNALAKVCNEKNYFLMIKTTNSIKDIVTFASMWNMDGLILMGFCENDYEELRKQMRISFVVYDGYFKECNKIVNLGIDHYDGGYKAGEYFKKHNHKKALCIADNYICMDKERIEGFKTAFGSDTTKVWTIPNTKELRYQFYEANYLEIFKNKITTIFAVSDFYALDLMHFLQNKNINIPNDVQIVGFDDSEISRLSNPSLSTIYQDNDLRALQSISCLEAMRDGKEYNTKIVLPVRLIERGSTDAKVL